MNLKEKLLLMLGLLILPLNISLEIIFNFIKNLNLKKSLINCFQIFLLLNILIPMVNAIDYDNISFTNQEFYNGAITDSSVLELSDGNLAVGYIRSGDFYLKICDLDGTNCGSEISILISVTAGAEGIDMFEDTTNNNIIYLTGETTNGKAFIRNLDGTANTSVTFNAGSTAYVSAVQTNSTHFAIAYQDTADVNDKGEVILCSLNGASCGTPQNFHSALAKSEWIKMILLSNGNLGIAHENGDSSLYYEVHSSTTGVRISTQSINGAATPYIDMIEGSDNKLKIVYRDDGNSSKGIFINCDLDGTNCGSEIVFNSVATGYISLSEFNNKLFISWRDATSDMININLTGGDISSISSFTINLSAYKDQIVTSNNQLLISYNDATNSKGMFAISESLTTSAVVTINNPIEAQYLDNLNFTLNVSIDLNTNLTYSLNGASNISLGIDINTSVSTITGIEGSNTIIVYSNYSGEISDSGLRTFTIDTINPTINNSIPATINSYNFLSSYFSCSEDYLSSCNISIDSLNKAQATNFSLTHNGNLSYTITAVDLAGNQANATGILFVNPYQYFRGFNLYNSTNITSFSLLLNNITSYNTTNGTIQFLTYDFNVNANNTLTMETLGYQSTIYTRFINTTSNYNQTLNFTTAIVQINFFDLDTLSTILNVDFTIDGSPFANNYSTSVGQANITDFASLPATYNIISNSDGYQQNSRYFTFTGKSNINLNIYLINSSITTAITIIVRDSQLDLLSGIFVTIKEYDITTNSYIEIDEKYTNNLGEVIFNLDIGDKYQFVLSDGVNTVTTIGQFITSTPIYLKFDPVVSKVQLQNYLNIYSQISFVNTDVNNTQGYFRWEYNDPSNTATQGCQKVYFKSGSIITLLNTSCSTGSGATIYSNTFNKTFGKTYIVKGIVTIDGEDIEIDNKTFIFIGDKGSWVEGLGLFFSFVLYLVLVLTAKQNEAHPVIITILALIPIFMGAFVKSLPITIGALVGFSSLLLYVIIFRRK